MTEISAERLAELIANYEAINRTTDSPYYNDIEDALRELSATRLKLDALCDRAYYDGAKQAAIIGNQSLEALDKWIAEGCGGRLQHSREALAAIQP